jgi:hypothetical protein
VVLFGVVDVEEREGVDRGGWRRGGGVANDE